MKSSTTTSSYKCWGVSLAADQYRDPIRYRAADFPENCLKYSMSSRTLSPNNLYVDSKLRNQAIFEVCFEDKYCFAYAFRAIKDENNRIDKDIRFLFRKRTNTIGSCRSKPTFATSFFRPPSSRPSATPQKQLSAIQLDMVGETDAASHRGHMKKAELRKALDSVRDVANPRASASTPYQRNRTSAFPLRMNRSGQPPNSPFL